MMWIRLMVSCLTVTILCYDRCTLFALGLAFSVLSPTKPPPSLKNVYKQIKEDIPSFVIPSSGSATFFHFNLQRRDTHHPGLLVDYH